MESVDDGEANVCYGMSEKREEDRNEAGEWATL